MTQDVDGELTTDGVQSILLGKLRLNKVNLKLAKRFIEELSQFMYNLGCELSDVCTIQDSKSLKHFLYFLGLSDKDYTEPVKLGPRELSKLIIDIKTTEDGKIEKGLEILDCIIEEEVCSVKHLISIANKATNTIVPIEDLNSIFISVETLVDTCDNFLLDKQLVTDIIEKAVIMLCHFTTSYRIKETSELFEHIEFREFLSGIGVDCKDVDMRVENGNTELTLDMVPNSMLGGDKDEILNRYKKHLELIIRNKIV